MAKQKRAAFGFSLSGSNRLVVACACARSQLQYKILRTRGRPRDLIFNQFSIDCCQNAFASGAPPRTPLGGLQRPPNPQLENVGSHLRPSISHIPGSATGSVQGKLCDLQPHLCDQQFPLQWQLTVSMIAFGDGRSPVVCGTRSPLASLQNPFCNGSKNSCCAMLACPHTLAWIWTRIICCLRAHDVGGSTLLSAICLQNRYHRSSGMLLIEMPSGQ